MSSIAIILLAAGSSSRLGTAKQQLPWRGTTLLDHTIAQALAVPEAITFVVVHKAIQLPERKDIRMVINDQYEEGIASSIRAGLRAAEAELPALKACLLMVCDQPYISTALLLQLIRAQQQSGKGIAAAAYNGIEGTPVLFDRHYRDALYGLNGDSGARRLLALYRDDMTTVSFPQGATDVDTPGDYKRLMASERGGTNDQG